MKFFIKKIFDGESDDLVHLQFQKFSRGDFKNRAMVRVKCTAKGCTINTGPEYANELVRVMAEKLGDENTDVKGVVVSTADLTGKLNFKNKKQFMGVKSYVIDGEMPGSAIVNLCDEFPECFIALSFKVGPDELKIKAKAPKSAKPSTKGGDEKPKIDFCKLKTSDLEMVKNVIWEHSGFKEAEIDHTFVIEDIEVPSDVKDPSEMRRLAKRKGKIVRTAVIDGKEYKSEKAFVA